MDYQLVGAAIIRSLSFASALIFLPLPFATVAIRLVLALVLFVSSLGQLPGGAENVQLLLLFQSWNDLELILPSGGDVVYNIAVGLFVAVLISTAVAAAFLSARWLLQILQTRFSAASLHYAEELPKSGVALSLILTASVFISDFFYQIFSSFDQSFEMLPLKLSELATSSDISSQFASALIHAGAEIFFIAFLSSSFLFFAVLVIVVSLLAGVKYIGQIAIRITDGGLSLIFVILVLSASVYASSAFIENAQQEVVAKISDFQIIQ